MEKCEYCEHIFKNKGSLKLHQTTAKYCIKMQKNNDNKINKYICEFCSKECTQQNNLSRHQQNCRKKYVVNIDLLSGNNIELENTNKILDNKIESLEKNYNVLEIKYIELKSCYDKTILKNITNKNSFGKLDILTTEYIQSQTNNLTINHALNGNCGLSDYIVKYPLKNRLICTDFSRRKYKYKDNKENIITEIELGTIMRCIFTSLKTPLSVLTTNYINNLKQTTKKETEFLNKKITEFTEQRVMIIDGINGIKTEQTLEIIKIICQNMLV